MNMNMNIFKNTHGRYANSLASRPIHKVSSAILQEI